MTETKIQKIENKIYKATKKALGTDIHDDRNPLYAFNRIHNDILAMIIKGELNVVEMAKLEMVKRGFDLNGEWIGHKAATELYFG